MLRCFVARRRFFAEQLSVFSAILTFGLFVQSYACFIAVPLTDCMFHRLVAGLLRVQNWLYLNYLPKLLKRLRKVFSLSFYYSLLLFWVGGATAPLAPPLATAQHWLL